MYERRTYRGWVEPEGLAPCHVSFRESELCVYAREDVTALVTDLVCNARFALESYIERDALFGSSLAPHEVMADAPELAKRMARAASAFGVGPMAAVAGAVAQHVGESIDGEVIVENGGDIYARLGRPLTVTLHAGERSPFGNRVRFTVDPKGLPVGICTSSGTLGHSRSFGRADAVCVIAEEAPLADAAATALCNEVQGPEDVDRVVKGAEGRCGIRGIIVAAGDKLGAWGEIEFV